MTAETAFDSYLSAAGTLALWGCEGCCDIDGYSVFDGSCLVKALACWLAYVYAALEATPLVPSLCCQADHTLLASSLHMNVLKFSLFGIGRAILDRG